MLTTEFVPGSPNWIDLGAPDVTAAADFYGRLFGWQFQPAGPEAGDYGFFQLDGRTVAAVGPLTEEGASSAWTVYFHTPDADGTAKTVEQAGGTVRFGPFDVFAEGRMVGFTDPAGARFAVWQPGDTKGLDAAGTPGTLCWAELHTPDPAAARAFYGTVFGWGAEEVPVPGMTYTTLHPSGRSAEDATFGGIAPLAEEAQSSGIGAHWLPYFEVADCDDVVARAEQLGARVLMPATTMEGVGRMAALADPSGASFSVITSVPG